MGKSRNRSDKPGPRGARCAARGRGTQRRTDGARAGRADLYEEVTRRIIGELEAGRVPWVQPWGKVGAPEAGLPCNAVTRRPYSGINILILWSAVIAGNWSSQRWLTFAQAQAAGGSVGKGERGTTVVFAGRFTPGDESGSDPQGRARGEDASDRQRDPIEGSAQDGAQRAIPFLRRYTLFNIAQCDGLEGLPRDPQPLPAHELVPQARALIAASGVAVRIGGNAAYYAPALDHVQLPPPGAFFEPLDFYRTCLHELTHATGHPARLDRDQSGAFGSKPYAREELVAEMGSAFLCAALGIAPTVRHADYLAHWLDVLRDDLSDDPAIRGPGAQRGRAIFKAASAASKAADWLLARHADAQGRQCGVAA